MPTVTINTDFPASLEPLLIGAVKAVLANEQQSPETELTVVLSDDQQLLELNLQFMGINSTTDVLSFTADEIDPETDSVYLGDVIISYERAQAQASVAGHSLEDELQLLVVHGILHLLGYDHADTHDKAQMWAVQAEILHQLGIVLTPS